MLGGLWLHVDSLALTDLTRCFSAKLCCDVNRVDSLRREAGVTFFPPNSRGLASAESFSKPFASPYVTSLHEFGLTEARSDHRSGEACGESVNWQLIYFLQYTI